MVADLLNDWSRGDRAAFDRLLPIVYSQLRRLARYHLRGERPDHTLESAALVHETCMRLMKQNRVRWQSRSHFLSVAAGMMRRVLVDYARARWTSKRGSGFTHIPLNGETAGSNPPDLDLIAIDRALSRLEEFDPGKARIVELRYFGGFTIEETAEAVELSPRTVLREWEVAKAWLLREITLGAGTLRGRRVPASKPRDQNESAPAVMDPLEEAG